MSEKLKYNYLYDNEEDWFEEKTPPKKSVDDRQPDEPRKKKPGMTSEELWKWSIFTACLLMGIMIALLFKTYKKEGEVATIYGQRKDLAEMVKYLQTERNRLQTDLAKARDIIKNYESKASSGSNQLSALAEQLNLVRQEAGLTAVKGPGIMITLDDSPRKPGPTDDPNFYIVHDIDLMALVNELWASGAEAISINDQRVVMNTAIRCVGPTITVNTVRLTPPYIVKAIGPSSDLETGLRYTGGFLDSMAPNIDRGVKIKIEKVNEIKISEFKGSLVNRYAKTYKP